jgi:hypothetical protein
MLIRPAIGDTDPIRYRRHTPDGQFSGNIIDEAMRPLHRLEDQWLGLPIGVGTPYVDGPLLTRVFLQGLI